MALGAIERLRGRMTKARHRPCRRHMTLGTLLAEQPLVTILGRVTGGAIESGLKRAGSRFERWRRAHPITEALRDPPSFTVRRLAQESGKSYAGEDRVIHRYWADTAPPVLRVAFRAAADIGVKRGGLSLKQITVIRVADDAARRLNSSASGVALRALVLEERMSGGEFTGTN